MADQMHRLADRPLGVPRLLGQRRRRLEADEREQAEDHPLQGRLDAVFAWDEDAKRVLWRR